MILRDDWWLAEEGEVYQRAFPHAETVEREQSDLRERFIRLACLYDPYERMGLRHMLDGPGGAQGEGVSLNVVKSAIDTATSIIAKSRPRATFSTDDADWSTQRRAKMLDRYCSGLFQQTKLYTKGPLIFRDAAVFGTGLLKLYPDERKIVVERALIEEIIVDENECRVSAPRNLQQRKHVDRDVLKGKFPDFEEQIDRAQLDRHFREYAGQKLEPNQVTVVESWHLPARGKGGRHVISLQNVDLFDEEYDRDWFPFVPFRWNERITGFYGCGIAEEIATIQRRINKLNRFIDAAQDQIAVPRVFVSTADAAMGVKITNRIGIIIPVKGKPPVFNTPQAVSQETYQRLDSLEAKALEYVGISRLSAQSRKPGGIDSAVALREYNDIETERFSIQAQRYEGFYLDIARMMVAIAKEMNRSAPKVPFRTRQLEKLIEWKDVDLDRDPFSMEIDAASSMSRTPAGRTQTVIEWAQAGIIDQDEARRLLRHPDLERTLSLYNAAIENIEHTIEELLDGDDNIVPEPYQNLQMGTVLVHRAYLKARDDGAPEDILEGMRVWLTQAEYVLAQSAPPPQIPPPMPQTAVAAPLAMPSATGPAMAAGQAPLPGIPG